MEQQKIWDYLQNDGLNPHIFSEARQRFMLRYLKPNQVVLNIGVGSGTLERLGIAKGVNMHSLDPSRKAIERLRESLGLAERAQVGFVESMQIGRDRFDAVIMSEVIEHLNDKNLADALDNVLRVLKSQGSLIISTPYREDLSSNLAVCPDCGKVFHKFGHVQSFDRKRIRFLLERKNFNIDKIFITSFVDWRRRGIFNQLKSFLRVVLARLGEGIADPHLVVIAHKSPKS
jgi:2-polyprenyl-3-methyl-5-hydroxy-6-metoxy-1,4-benzoquinol methylase